MKWFKHFSNASDSVKLNKLIDELGIEGYGRYWLLLELIAQETEQGSEKVEIHYRKISSKVHIKFTKTLGTFLAKLQNFGLIEVEVVGKVYILSCPILGKLQDKDSKYNRTRVVKQSSVATLDIDKNKSREDKIRLDKMDFSHVTKIIDLWNSHNLKAIKKTPESIRQVAAIVESKLINKIGYKQLELAIKNYASVKLIEDSWYTQNYTLKAFLNSTNAYDRFSDLNFTTKEYERNKSVFKTQPRSKYAN